MKLPTNVQLQPSRLPVTCATKSRVVLLAEILAFFSDRLPLGDSEMAGRTPMKERIILTAIG